jgi:hypothetical protein
MQPDIAQQASLKRHAQFQGFTGAYARARSRNRPPKLRQTPYFQSINDVLAFPSSTLLVPANPDRMSLTVAAFSTASIAFGSLPTTFFSFGAPLLIDLSTPPAPPVTGIYACGLPFGLTQYTVARGVMQHFSSRSGTVGVDELYITWLFLQGGITTTDTFYVIAYEGVLAPEQGQ